ncbi:MAG TPA: DUF1192 domain-containing protein [Caulobacteraceae bacterium]|nr:DUF1192 domain-containing protein [Caulobacteraceae bacterium]
MAEEPAEVRRQRGQALTELMREDLEVYGVAELKERIEALEAEIARTRAQMDRKQAGRAAADALFARRD